MRGFFVGVVPLALDMAPTVACTLFLAVGLTGGDMLKCATAGKQGCYRVRVGASLLTQR